MIDPVAFKIVDTSRDNEVIDSIEYSRAFFELFAGEWCGVDCDVCAARVLEMLACLQINVSLCKLLLKTVAMHPSFS